MVILKYVKIKLESYFNRFLPKIQKKENDIFEKLASVYYWLCFFVTMYIHICMNTCVFTLINLCPFDLYFG